MGLLRQLFGKYYSLVEHSHHDSMPLSLTPYHSFYRRRENPDGWEHKLKYEADEEEGTGSNGAHYAANIGDVDTLTWIIENPQHRAEMIHEHDYNGWLPIHEAARNGHTEIIEVLVEHGVDINERTNFGEGQSVLSLAYDYFEEDHPFIKFLLTLGAKEIEPEEEL